MKKVDREGKITEDYPGFIVHNDRVSGSITLGHSRLPLWCLITGIVDAGYSAAVESYPDEVNRASADEIGLFLYDLLENRKEFARLLCVLADVERRERETKWNAYGPNAAYLYGSTSQVREEIAPVLADIGIGPIIQVDPQNRPPALRLWYSNTQNVSRVRTALLDCLDHLDHLAALSTDGSRTGNTDSISEPGSNQ